MSGIVKKTLIFGLGRQAIKHINYFSNKGYNITSVNSSGINKLCIKGVDKIFKFDNIKKLNKNYFIDFTYIVVCINPIFNQTTVVKLLLDLGLKNNIILEKPVTYDIILLKKLIKLKNITFFIDEVYFSRLFMNKNIKNINLYLTNNDFGYIEHSLGFFLLNNNFINIINSINISYINNKNPIMDNSENSYMYYKLSFLSYEILCDKGFYYINNKLIGKDIFGDSLNYILEIILNNSKFNYLYKNNFYLLQNAKQTKSLIKRKNSKTK